MNKKTILIITLVVGMLGLTLNISFANGENIQRKVFGGGVEDADAGNVQISATLGQPVIGAYAGDTTSLGAGYWHGLGYDETKCGLSESSTYHYNQTYPVTITIDTLGDIDCIRVLRKDGNHPQATANLQTGRSWTITATDNDGSPATGFELTLTLLAPFTPDGTGDKLCRYTGDGIIWDCAATGYNATNNTITRSGITELSDWAVGDQVGPTAIRLITLQAHNVNSVWWMGFILGVVMLLAIRAGFFRPSKRAKETCDDITT